MKQLESSIEQGSERDDPMCGHGPGMASGSVVAGQSGRQMEQDSAKSCSSWGGL